MRKKSFVLLVSTTLGCSILFSSCIGSFGLFNKVLDWNKNISSKFVNEIVFVAFSVVPVYAVSMLADFLVVNAIEFWSGSNPVADAGHIQKVETKNGIYAIKTEKDGYTIQKEGEKQAVNLVFNEADQTWNVKAEGKTSKLLKFKNDNEVVMYLPDGKEMDVELSQAGVYAFKQVAEGYSYYAAR